MAQKFQYGCDLMSFINDLCGRTFREPKNIELIKIICETVELNSEFTYSKTFIQSLLKLIEGTVFEPRYSGVIKSVKLFTCF
jgi:hypothetical protein